MGLNFLAVSALFCSFLLVLSEDGEDFPAGFMGFRHFLPESNSFSLS